MAGGEFTLRPKIEIDGTELSADLEVLLESVVVEDHLHTPDMFTLTFRDTSKQVLQQAKVEMGSKVKISALPLGGSTPDLLISGEVTGFHGGYGAAGTLAVVHGYDASHRLHHGRVTQTYRNVKDSDIARTVASRNNLQEGKIDDSKTTQEHVSQVNLSDWDLLQSRAGEIGFEVSVEDGKLNFRQPTPSSEAPGEGDYHSGNPLQLVFGSDLLEFHPRVSSAEQVKDVKSRGWDPKTKQAIIGSAAAGASSAASPDDPCLGGGEDRKPHLHHGEQAGVDPGRGRRHRQGARRADRKRGRGGGRHRPWQPQAQGRRRGERRVRSPISSPAATR